MSFRKWLIGLVAIAPAFGAADRVEAGHKGAPTGKPAASKAEIDLVGMISGWFGGGEAKKTPVVRDDTGAAARNVRIEMPKNPRDCADVPYPSVAAEKSNLPVPERWQACADIAHKNLGDKVGGLKGELGEMDNELQRFSNSGVMIVEPPAEPDFSGATASVARDDEDTRSR